MKALLYHLCGYSRLPSTKAIDNYLIKDEYLYVMKDVLFTLSKMLLIYVILDTIMNFQDKLVINLMACSSIAIFLEHFTIVLRKKKCNKSIREGF